METRDKRTELMASEKIGSAIWRLAVPSIVSLVVLAIYNMADTYFVSLVSDSDLEVAAVSVYMPILLVTQALSVLFASGGGAYLSRLLGEKNLPEASRTATTTIVMAFLSGVLVLAVGMPNARSLLLFVGASSETIGMALDYALIMMLTAPVQLTNMAFNNLLRAEGNAIRSMAGLVTGAVLNMVLDPIFISGLGQGVMGAAIATAISQCVSFVILGSAYWGHHTTAVVRFRGFRLQTGTLGYILRIGLSTFLIQIFTALGFAIINIYAKNYGDGTIAAIGIVNRLQYLGFAVLFGFSQGFQPVCGYNYGARRFHLLHRTLWFGVIMAVLLGGAITLLFRVEGSGFIGLFASERTVIQTGITVLDWFTAAYPLTAFSLIMMMACQSLGRAAGAIVIACCRQGWCMIPLVIILARTLGFAGLLAAPLLSDITSGIISAVMAVRLKRFISAQRAGTS